MAKKKIGLAAVEDYFEEIKKSYSDSKPVASSMRCDEWAMAEARMTGWPTSRRHTGRTEMVRT